MPTTDWNWFFSSVAQSAAAIVGIFGAFIVTKILANQSAFSEKTQRVHELVSRGKKLADAAGRLSFSWYHKHDSADELRAAEELLEKDDSLTPDALYDKLRFSPYLRRADAIAALERTINLRKNRLERERKEAQRRMEEARTLGMARLLDTGQNDMLMRSLRSPMLDHLRPQLEKEREEMDLQYVDVKHHIREVANMHADVSTHPESSSVITAALILILLLFFLGVIYPLSFMPLPTDWKPELSLTEVPAVLFSLRGALLSVVSLLFSSMLAMFFFMNVRLKYPAALLTELDQFARLETYSPFFKTKDDNASAKRPTEG